MLSLVLLFMMFGIMWYQFALSHHYISNQYFAGFKPFDNLEKADLASKAVLSLAVAITAYYFCDWAYLARMLSTENGEVSPITLQLTGLTLIVAGAIYFLLGYMTVKLGVPED